MFPRCAKPIAHACDLIGSRAGCELIVEILFKATFLQKLIAQLVGELATKTDHLEKLVAKRLKTSYFGYLKS